MATENIDNIETSHIVLPMEDVEQKCEDALFKLCDARERYPIRCADELQKSIKLDNDINMLKVFQKSTTINESIQEQNERFNIILNQCEICFNHLDDRLQNIINKLDNLKAVTDQIEREKKCLTNILLES